MCVCSHEGGDCCRRVLHGSAGQEVRLFGQRRQGALRRRPHLRSVRELQEPLAPERTYQGTGIQVRRLLKVWAFSVGK